MIDKTFDQVVDTGESIIYALDRIRNLPIKEKEHKNADAKRIINHYLSLTNEIEHRRNMIVKQSHLVYRHGYLI